MYAVVEMCVIRGININVKLPSVQRPVLVSLEYNKRVLIKENRNSYIHYES